MWLFGHFSYGKYAWVIPLSYNGFWNRITCVVYNWIIVSVFRNLRLFPILEKKVFKIWVVSCSVGTTSPLSIKVILSVDTILSEKTTSLPSERFYYQLFFLYLRPQFVDTMFIVRRAHALIQCQLLTQTFTTNNDAHFFIMKIFILKEVLFLL